jgi:hypothetical protein
VNLGQLVKGISCRQLLVVFLALLGSFQCWSPLILELGMHQSCALLSRLPTFLFCNLTRPSKYVHAFVVEVLR